MHQKPEELTPFLSSKIVIDEYGCWLWSGGLNRNGYGTYQKSIGKGKRKRYMVHIVVYKELKGDYPKGLFLDHACKVRSCCNPSHLEPVTPLVNTLRGDAILFKAKGITYE